MSKDPKPKWKKGDVIRSIKDDSPFLVVHVYANVATMIVSLLEEETFPRIILPRSYDLYSRESDIVSLPMGANTCHYYL